MILWVFVGLLIAFALARINQSNKLFWILFTSFVVGIASSSVYTRYRKQCKTESSSYYHTPLTHMPMNNCCSVTIGDDVYSNAIALTTAGNGGLEHNDDVKTLSACYVKARNHPPKTAERIKNTSMYFDTS